MYTGKYDVSVINHGSIILFALLTKKAKEWVEKNVSEEAQFFGGNLVVEPRYAENLAVGMYGDGLNIKRGT